MRFTNSHLSSVKRFEPSPGMHVVKMSFGNTRKSSFTHTPTHIFEAFAIFFFWVSCSGFKSGDVQFLSYPDMNVWKVLGQKDRHEYSITDIKYSSNDKFVAIVDKEGTLSIMHCNTHEIYKRKESHFIAWHPWKASDLFIGRRHPAHIYLFDVTTKSVRAFYQCNNFAYILHALAINPLTSELVASFTNENKQSSEILVLGSMDRIVDSLSAHQRAVNFIMWNPAGTHIG